MKKTDFNTDWSFKRLKEGGEGIRITVPHDAMCGEKRSLKSRGRHNIGWFESDDYLYTKRFFVPSEYNKKCLCLEFEGVYRNAEVYVNGQKAAVRPYGYTNFTVALDEFLKYNDENEVQVIARNKEQPNSRWYTGSGLYRPVWLYEGDIQHIPINGVKIRTLSHNPAQIVVQIQTTGPGAVSVEILDKSGKSVAAAEGVSRPNNGRIYADIPLYIPDAALWSPQSPVLYTCIAKYESDEVREQFGIRTVTWTSEKGIAINGERIILKGACIHHDNGVLGACAFPEAEERRVRILKETGYNALRMAHNPCSRALLEACDRQGVLVMDEYTDMWYIHKTEYDYASYMTEWWPKDLKDMTDKDFNHPSVIMYSIGNEVAETGEKKGIELTEKMTGYLHELDDTRPVSCGINIFFNLLYSLGFGVYSDRKAKKEDDEADITGKKKTVGSEFYNTLAGLLGDTVMKAGATLHLCDVKTRDAFARMDVAGYNYGIFRYKHDLKKYPERLILGSETFCKDAYRFYELAKKEPRLVGDFVWAGIDYIGEAGIGAWEYEDYAPTETEDAGWLTAGSGRINILGYPNGEAAYTRVALEKEKGPLIAVKPVYQKGKHSPSAWKMTDAMESWTWPGCEGDRAIVEVYARAAAVELFVNGSSVGKKKLKNTCNVTFKTRYESGNVMAAAYDENGREIARHSLQTAGTETRLSVLPEQNDVPGGGLAFIQLRYTDLAGIWKPMEKHSLKITVENGILMGLGNACSYNPDGYWKNTVKTYYGEALAVVRAGERGTVRLLVTDENRGYVSELKIV